MKKLYDNLLKLQELEFGDMTDGDAGAQISALRRKIPPPILQHYDRLTARGKEGVAVVRHQVCMGCYMRIPIGAINTLMHADDIQMCDNCGRYLYLPPEEREGFLEVSEETKAAGAASRPTRKMLTHS